MSSKPLQSKILPGLIAFFFGLWMMPVLHLQAQEPHFHHYTVAEGLSHIATHSPGRSLHDSEGFMWFATMDGLVRFDGHTFKKYRFSLRDPYSLGNNQTTAICQAADGKIWVGTGSAGIYIFDPETERFTALRHQEDNPNSLCGDGINFLATDRDGHIWIGTRFSGICRYNPQQDTFLNYAHLFRDGEAFYQQQNGTIWIGSGDGLTRYEPDQNRFHRFPVNPEMPDTWVQNVTFDITEDALGRLWTASAFNGLHIFDPETQVFQEVDKTILDTIKENPKAVTSDRNGNIWISGTKEVFYYRVKEQTLARYQHDPENPGSCPKGQITDLYMDKAGSIWFTVQGIGISVVHAPQSPFEVITNFGVENFEQLDDRTLLLSAPTGIQQFDIFKKTLTPFPLPEGFSNSSIGEILHTQKGVLWVANNESRQILSHNTRTGQNRIYPFHGMFLAEDSSGGVWGANKLLYFDDDTQRWINKHDSLKQSDDPDTLSRNPLDIIIDHQDRIWISSDDDGLRMYDPASNRIRAFRHDPDNPNSLPSNILYDLYLSSDGKIYAGTIHGLSILDLENDTIVNITESEGLAQNKIQSIIEDQAGSIWIATINGISRLDIPGHQIKNFYYEDGIPLGKPIVYVNQRDDQGYLYFSTYENAYRFHPDSLWENTSTAPVHLVDLYLDHQLILPCDTGQVLNRQLRYVQNLELGYRQNDFGFSFTMPVYEKAEQIEFFFQLEGYDEDWRSTYGREIHYTNIDPGDYTFQVKARNSDGFWTDREAKIELSILPPWWRTWWAYGGFSLLVLAVLTGIYRFDLTRQLAKAEAKRLQEMDEVKTRFFTNITHEFRTPLTVIIGMIDNIKGHFSERDLIRRNSQNLLRLINQLLDLSKLDSGTANLNLVHTNIVHYLRYLTESFHSAATEKQIQLTFSAEEPSLSMDVDEEKIQQIVYNLLSNALKFTSKGGAVDFRISKIKQAGHAQLQLEVSDTGNGIPEEQLPHIFDRFYQVDSSTTRKGEGTGIGLALTRELVRLMGGTITVKSQPGKGSCFTVCLPIQKDPKTPKWEPGRAQEAPDYTFNPTDSTSTNAPVYQPDTALQNAKRPLLLIIEDNPDVIVYIESLLQKDYRIKKAGNGHAGIAMALDLIPDIIITDLMMPIKDGYKVCSTLKSDQRTSHIPIVMLTAKATDEDRIAGLKTGADAYLMKPFHKEELFVRLSKLIELRSALQAHYQKAVGPLGTLQTPQKEPKGRPSLDEQFINTIRKLIEERIGDTTLDIEALCQAVRLSPTQLSRKMNALTGMPPMSFIRKVRLHKARKLLQTTDLSVAEIAYEVGFSDPNYFSRVFSKEFKQPPSAVSK